MVQQSTYGQVSPFLRGLTGYQVLNLVDGVRLNNTTFRSGPNQYLAFVDPSQGGRIEAMLGPASAQFGSDAMGGAIQVLTPEVRFSTRGRWMTAGAVNLFAGSADESRGADAIGVPPRPEASRACWASTRRQLGDLRAGGGRDSHHVLHRLFGLDDEQNRGVCSAIARWTRASRSRASTPRARRASGADQNVTAWYQRSDQDDVRGYKDLWGGLGRLQSDFDPQRLQLFYARYERLNVGPARLAERHVLGQRPGRRLHAPEPPARRSDRRRRRGGVDAFGYAVQAGAHLGARHALVFGGEVYDEHVDARRDETNPVSGAIGPEACALSQWLAIHDHRPVRAGPVRHRPRR